MALDWLRLAFYAVVLLVSLRILLPVTLYLFLPSLRISSCSPLFGLGGITFVSSIGGRKEEERIRVEIGHVGLSVLGSKNAAKGWFVLKLTGVKVVVPRQALLASPRRRANRRLSHTSQVPTPILIDDETTPPQKSTLSLRRLASIVHTRLIHPSLIRLNRIISTLTSALTLFAIQVDLTVQVDDVLLVTGVLSAGVEVGGVALRPSKESSLPPDEDLTTRLGVWASLARVELHEWRSDESSAPSVLDADDKSRPVLLPALTMHDRLLVSLSAPLGPRHGLLSFLAKRGRGFAMPRSSVRTSVAFGGGQAKNVNGVSEKGVHVRVHELKRVMTAVEELVKSRKEDARKEEDQQGEDDHEENSHRPTKISPLVYLRSIELSVPSFIVSAHYDTPLHILAASPKRQLPQSVAFAATVRGVYGKLLLGGQSDFVKREHLEWLGKGRTLGLGGRLSWEEIEGRVLVDGPRHETPPHSAKAFSLGSSYMHVTSTFVPPQLVVSSLGAVKAPPYVCTNHNDKTLIVEGHLGQIRGHTTFETLDSALRIFKARPRRHVQHKSGRAAKVDLAATLSSLPRIVGAVDLDGIELRIQAPLNAEVREEDDPFFRSWSSPELFCISSPNASLSFGGEYSDRSVKRTEVDRRQAKRVAKHKEAEAEERKRAQQASQAPTSPTAEFEAEFGVPPPPPITSNPRRNVPSRHDATLSRNLDIHSLRYTTRVHVSTDVLNVYILATSHSYSHADDDTAAAWLDEKPVLPSDPVRLDILAIGPVEISSHHITKGSEKDGPSGTAPVLDLATNRGSLNLLVEEIGIDLWRPVVMGSLRDFVSSFASASAASTLRTPSSLPTPDVRPYRPMIDVLPCDLAVYVAVATFDMRIAGSDPKNDEQACRGVALHCGPTVSEYLLQREHQPRGADFVNRQGLDMREDIRVEANANIAELRGQRRALLKLALSAVNIDPVVDARASRGHTRRYSSSVASGHNGDGGQVDEEDWELKNRSNISDLVKRRRSIMPVRSTAEKVKGILHIPHIALRVRIAAAPNAPSKLEEQSDTPLDEIEASVESEQITLRLELLSIYLCLVAVSALRSLSSKSSQAPAMRPPPSDPPPRSRRKPLVKIRADVADLNAFVTLPHRVNLFLHLRRLRVQQSRDIGVLVEFDNALLAGESPTALGKWDDIVRIRVVVLAIRPEANNNGHQPFVVALTADSARLRIPFRYVFSKIIDNVATLVKAVKQLVHQHVKGGMGFVIDPEVEEAKKLPEIRLQVKMFVIEIQDDPFETRLNIIWRAGFEEQSARLDREAAFSAKVEAIRRADANGGESSGEEEEEEQNGRPSTTRRPRVSARHSVGVDEARYALRAYNSSHWIKRMRNAVAEQGRREEALTRRLYGIKHSSHRPDSLLPIDLLPPSRSVPLARGMLHDLRLTVTRTSFPDKELPDFLHDVGKGLPRDTQFSLLVPINLSIKMEELRLNVRDYPLPLLHVPPMSSTSGSHEFASLEWDSDLVIGEEIGGPESIRYVPTEIVSAHAAGARKSQLYSIVVPRSAMTTKTYCTPTLRIRTPFPTRIGWGNSISPALQDITRVVDTLSKATPDPSEKIGIWDKLRLQFHWRIRVLFQGEGPVHFHLKGSRDPYMLHGFGAGFAKSWHGNVRFLINMDNPDREVLQILSDEYVLGIPNLRDYIDSAATGMGSRDPTENSDGATQHSGATSDLLGRYRAVDYEFTKVCAKFINGVRWGIGVVLERACGEDCSKSTCHGKTPFHRQCRIFDFIPHWEVHTKTEAAIGPQGEFEDSFANFRSDFIHFSISLTSPLTLSLPSNPDSSPPSECAYDGRDGYNSMHFTPQALTHFKRWWKLFDGTMSLPIRRGKLFPTAIPPSKKFGKHCATIKYRFSLAPLFLSHTYRQESWNEWNKGETTVMGLKGKLGRFNVDLHQREQEETVINPDTGERKTVMHKAFYMAEIDLDSVDLRAITALFKEPEKAVAVPEELAENSEEDQGLPAADDYILRDEDLDWVDLDDYVDALYKISDNDPQLRVLPFIVSPRFTYYRHVDAAAKTGGSPNMERSHSKTSAHEGGYQSGDTQDKAKTKFGNEPSHTCLMGCSTDSVMVQINAAEARLAELQKGLDMLPRGATDTETKEFKMRIAAVQRIIERLVQVRDWVSPDKERSEVYGEEDAEQAKEHAQESKAPRSRPPYGSAPQTPASHAESEDRGGDDFNLPHITSTLYQQWGMWENRYMVHNPTIQINNLTREVLLKYYYSSSERRGFMYHLSASAIKFIRDLAREHEVKNKRNWSRRKSTRTGSARRGTVFGDKQAANKLLDQLAARGKGTSWASTESKEDARTAFGDALDVDPDHAADHLPDDYDLNSGHLCMFIKPQIALRSDIDDESTIILTAFRAQLKVFSVVDMKIADDPVNSHVLHQTFAVLDGLQVFYPRDSARNGVTFGRSTPSTFVPLETLVDLRVEPWGFDRVVPRFSAALRYDKFNQLRMSSKKGEARDSEDWGPQNSHFASGTDRMSVECEKFSVSANPDHFKAIYNVVTDLMLYSDPAQKTRNSKLEAVVFTHDFSNLAPAVDIILGLQQRIRTQVDLQMLYQIHLDELDDSGRLELFNSRAETRRLSEELSLVIEAITRAQDINGASKLSGTGTGVQFEARATELVWHMLDNTDTPFAKFSVSGAEFSWISKQDSSVSNRLIIQDLKALNSSPEHIFAEIISKNERITDHELAKVDIFVALLWNTLPPVGGISIVEQLEVHLRPLKLQLEHRVGRQILDYVFAQRRQQKQQESNDSKPASGTATPSSNRPPSIMIDASANKSSESLSQAQDEHRSSHGLYRMQDRIAKSGRFSTANSSAVSVSSAEKSLRHVASSEILSPGGYEQGLDAEEMRRRAALNKAFILVDLTPTVLCLTYRSEKEDHSPLPDIYNITYTTPSIQYRSKTWSFLDLLNELKKDTIRSVWSQKGALIGQLIKTAHRKLPLTDARSAAKRSIKSSIRSRLHLGQREQPAIDLHAPSSPLARTPSDDSSRVLKKKPSGLALALDSDSSRSEDDVNVHVDAGENLPFDVEDTHLLDVDQPYSQEPEQMSVSGTSGGSLSRTSSGSVSTSGGPTEAKSLPVPAHSDSSSGQAQSKHSLSLPPLNEASQRRGSMSPSPFKAGHVSAPRASIDMRHQRLAEDEKAKLLMGVSFE